MHRFRYVDLNPFLSLHFSQIVDMHVCVCVRGLLVDNRLLEKCGQAVGSLVGAKQTILGSDQPF